MLIAYDGEGNIVATLDHMVARDAEGKVLGLHDFAEHEARGRKLRDFWDVSGAAGSATWPEWLGSRAHEFRVELDGKRAARLVHKESGHVRHRDRIEREVDKRMKASDRADLRDLLGGPSKPMVLGPDGK